MSFSQLRRVLSVMDANLPRLKSILHYGGILDYCTKGWVVAGCLEPAGCPTAFCYQNVKTAALSKRRYKLTPRSF